MHTRQKDARCECRLTHLYHARGRHTARGTQDENADCEAVVTMLNPENADFWGQARITIIISTAKQSLTSSRLMGMGAPQPHIGRWRMQCVANLEYPSLARESPLDFAVDFVRRGEFFCGGVIFLKKSLEKIWSYRGNVFTLHLKSERQSAKSRGSRHLFNHLKT